MEFIGTYVTRFGEQVEPEHRYASFDYCFNYFQQHKKNPSSIREIDLETSCLQLGFYLASWGMMRGSTFLLQRSVKHFERVLGVIAEAPTEFWEIDLHAYTPASIDQVLELAELIRGSLSPALVDARSRGATDTLVTKVMLGVFGCVPAFDQYFRSGFKVGGLSRTALERLAEYYDTHHGQIDESRQFTIDFETGLPTEFRYSRAKVVDMHFFMAGLSR